MRVRSADLFKLIEDSWDKLESEYNESFKSMNAQFFDKLASYIQVESKNKYKLKGATLYKQYYLKIKENIDGLDSDFIGITPLYLAALSNFLYNKPFEEIGIQPLSESQEEIPEFPSHHASFPSTPTIPLPLSNFKDNNYLASAKISNKTKNILLKLFKYNEIQRDTFWIKDESINPNGTHKDRMAWEIYLWYDSEIKKQINTPDKKISLKSLSLISSGSAAFSLQKILRDRGLPNLRVLMDKDTNPKLVEFLKNHDCKVYLTNLDSKELSSKEILTLTDNSRGLDLTYSSVFNSNREIYYDWLTYEVLNQNPNWVFIPFGTGELYKNIVNRSINELDKKISSKRFFGDKKIIMNCNFLGASTDNKKSKMKMLYSKFQNKSILNINKKLQNTKKIGDNSSVALVDEVYLKSAIEIGKHFNLVFEPSGISGMALLFQMIDNNQVSFNANDKIILINTGKSITSNYY